MKTQAGDRYFQGLMAGDSLVIQAFMDRYFPMIDKLVQANSGSREDAEDVFMYGMQQLFLKAKAKTLYAGAALSTILYSICYKRWLNVLRKKHPEIELTEEQERVLRSEDYLSPEEEEKLERLRLIQHCMQHIPEDCRQVINKSFYSDDPMKEIAEQLDMTYGYVRVRKTKCLDKLRKLVKEAIRKRP
jgi:RNA polymerase sigma factor (sigma-70 family)